MLKQEPKCQYCGCEECQCFSFEDEPEPQGIQEIYDASDEE